jgi:Carboxypeptidase regulatory-like domain
MKLSSRGLAFLLAMAALLILSGLPTMAQSSSSGAVSGIVIDQQGAVIPGVEIKLVDPSTNITLTNATNDAGRYIIPNVNPGNYNITFTKQGFSSRRVAKQVVEVGTTLTINATLEVGAVSNVVEVTSAPGAELPPAVRFRRVQSRELPAGRFARRRDRRRDVRPEYIPARWRQQLERYGRFDERLHRQLLA